MIKTCPLCGKDNGCAFNTGSDPKACWCMSLKVPKGLLNQVPPDKKGKSCVCKACVLKYLEDHPQEDEPNKE